MQPQSTGVAMTLDEYLNRQPRGALRWLAQALEVEESTIWRWRRGKSVPHASVMLEIEKITEGGVRPSDWFPSLEASE